jgi:plasmid stability protein
MQYTIRNIPRDVDQALRRRAREEARSLNEVAVDALRRALGLAEEPVAQRDLKDIQGTWVDDPEIDAALAEQRQIDPELWR